MTLKPFLQVQNEGQINHNLLITKYVSKKENKINPEQEKNRKSGPQSQTPLHHILS